MVEAAEGMAIPAIFAERGGELAFRAAESAAIRALPQDRGGVVATGGGAVLLSDNVQALRSGSLTMFLDADATVLAARTAGSTRPPLTALSPGGRGGRRP